MSPAWQQIVVMLAVAAAGGYLAYASWRTLRRRKAGCGTCARCPAEGESHGQDVVPLQSFDASMRLHVTRNADSHEGGRRNGRGSV